MGHTYTNLLAHIIFSTKDRSPYFRHPKAEDVFSYIGGITKQIHGFPLRVGGHDDHVHLLARIPAALPVADVVRTVKSNSCRWVHDNNVLAPSFAWQEGYAAFSVSESSAPQVVQYISNQAEHHRKVSFREELISFLKKNGIAYDDRFIWS
jgi:REP element-mobilizing transposase RayT